MLFSRCLCIMKSTYAYVLFKEEARSLFMKGKGTNMLRFGMNVQNTTRGVSCDALHNTGSNIGYYSRC